MFGRIRWALLHLAANAGFGPAAVRFSVVRNSLLKKLICHVFIFLSFMMSHPKVTVGDVSLSHVPRCHTEDAVRAARNAFNNGPFSKNYNIALLDIQDIVESHRNEREGTRLCRGIGYTNAGKASIKFAFEAQGDGRYWIEVHPELWSKVRLLWMAGI